jgi:hypothetical protein
MPLQLPPLLPRLRGVSLSSDVNQTSIVGPRCVGTTAGAPHQLRPQQRIQQRSGSEGDAARKAAGGAAAQRRSLELCDRLSSVSLTATHVDASEVQGQVKGETQHAEQVAVEAKASQSLRDGLLGSLSQTDSASTQGNTR